MYRPKISRRWNALLAWGVVAVLVGAVAVLLAWGAPVEASMAAVVALLTVGPPAVRRDWRAMPPWGIPAVATLPFVLRDSPLLADVSAYLAVAAVSLLVAIYLTAFTEVEMTTQFAVAFVVLTTIAVGTLWTAVRGLAQLYLGFSTLGGLDALEWDLLAVTAGGVLAGLVFEAYFRERNYGGLRGVPVEEA